MMEAILSPSKTAITQAQLALLDAEDKHIEVDDGIIIESDDHMPPIHTIVIQLSFEILNAWVKAHGLGVVFVDGIRYLLEGRPDDVQRAYKPDVSFVRSGLIPADFNWMKDDLPLAPTLAVEVVSPGQSNPKVLKRVTRYLESGTEEVWLIYPKQKTLYQYRRESPTIVAIYQRDEAIDVTPLFGDLVLRVSDLFVTP
jgi:Uma2 family endonuclease